MKLKLIVVVLITLNSIFLTAIGQTLPDSGFTNKAEAKNRMVNGLKEGKWLEYLNDSLRKTTDTNAPYYTLSVYYKGYRNGIERTYYKNGKLEDEFYEEGSNGVFSAYPIYTEEEGWLNLPDSGFTNKAEAKNVIVHGKKEGKWVEYIYNEGDAEMYIDTPDTATYYRLIIYKLDTPIGMTRDYYMNGKLKKEEPYSNGIIKGLLKSYYPNGSLEYEAFYNDSGFVDSKGYYPNGNIRVETPKNCYVGGIDKEYYENGKLKDETPYTNDKVNGIYKEFYENGKLKREIIYTNGNKGITKNYDENGNEIK